MTSGIKRRQTNEEQLVWIATDRTLSQSNPGAGRYALAGTRWLQSEPISNQCFLQLNNFIDHSIIEVFESQQDRRAITTRVYPEDDIARNLAVYVNRGSATDEFIIINSLDNSILDSIWI
jgi:sucrose-6-phosphate hydrolase SacC (GH32 family)